MDGARFANALVSLGATPAEATWKAGVDILAFGATKNGALAAEAVILFGATREKREELHFRRKRGGHLFSKMRFLSAQLEAYLEGDLWLANARNANARAARLAEGLGALAGVEFLYPVEANELFLRLPAAVIEGLRAEGHLFYDWGRPASYKQRQDICDAVAVFYECLGGKVGYSRQPEPVKYVCAGMQRKIIRKRFPTITALRQYLETFDWPGDL